MWIEKISHSYHLQIITFPCIKLYRRPRKALFDQRSDQIKNWRNISDFFSPNFPLKNRKSSVFLNSFENYRNRNFKIWYQQMKFSYFMELCIFSELMKSCRSSTEKTSFLLFLGYCQVIAAPKVQHFHPSLLIESILLLYCWESTNFRKF